MSAFTRIKVKRKLITGIKQLHNYVAIKAGLSLSLHVNIRSNLTVVTEKLEN